MQVSVPGIYKNPAPYREQILTYSTALALTGRSTAFAIVMAAKLVDEPRTRLLIIFMCPPRLSCRDRLFRCGVKAMERALAPRIHPQVKRQFERQDIERET